MHAHITTTPATEWFMSRLADRIGSPVCWLLIALLLGGPAFGGSLVSPDSVSPEAFRVPPLEARPGAYWCWLNGYVDRNQITREMEQAKALGMRGFEIWDVGVIRPVGIVPVGPAFLGEESLQSIQHAMTEAKRLGLELGMITASSWNAGGSWVKKSDGSKRLASSAVDVKGPRELDRILPLPCETDTYFYDISVLAVPQSARKELVSLDSVIELTDRMDDNGRLRWNVPEGDWTIMRFVCRGTNQGLVVPSPKSKGLIIDHLSAGATERHMLHMINKLAEIDPGHKILTILSHDSYEVNPANDWTEDFVDEFKKRRRYDPGSICRSWKAGSCRTRTSKPVSGPIIATPWAN